MLYYAGLGLRKRRLKWYTLDGDFKNISKRRKYDAPLDGAFENNNKSAYFVGLGVGNTQHMQCFARLGIREQYRATFIFPSNSQKLVNAMLCWNGPLHTKWIRCVAQLSFRKHNSAHLSFLRSFKGRSKLYFVCWASEHTTNAIFGRAEPLQTQPIQCFAPLNFRKHRTCHVYLSSAFSALLRTVLCAQPSRTRSKSLIVRASLWSTDFVRQHSRLRRDMRI